MSASMLQYTFAEPANLRDHSYLPLAYVKVDQSADGRTSGYTVRVVAAHMSQTPARSAVALQAWWACRA